MVHVGPIGEMDREREDYMREEEKPEGYRKMAKTYARKHTNQENNIPKLLSNYNSVSPLE